MDEFGSLERCAAYVAARTALSAVQRVNRRWPLGLAERAYRAATDAMLRTADAASHERGSPERRRYLRDAITSAIGVAATVDIARAMGHGGSELLAVQRLAGRTVALLAMFLHASAPSPEHA